MAIVGTGSAFTFSGYTANVLSIGWTGIDRAYIDTTHMGTSTARSGTPADLYDPGEVEIGHEFHAGNVPLTSGTAALSIQFGSETATSATNYVMWSANAYLSGFEIDDPLEDRITARARFRCVGAITQS